MMSIEKLTSILTPAERRAMMGEQTNPKVVVILIVMGLLREEEPYVTAKGQQVQQQLLAQGEKWDPSADPNA